jgi:adenylate cyclase
MTREVVKTIWISDMSRFTLFTYEHGPERVYREICQMRRIVRRVLKEHGGRVFKYEADNVFAVFPRPLPALKASLDVLDRLPPSQGICIGIGHGPLLYIKPEDDFYGMEINLASKLGEDLARPGELLLTEEAWIRLPGLRRPLFKGPFKVKVGPMFFRYYRFKPSSASSAGKRGKR